MGCSGQKLTLHAVDFRLMRDIADVENLRNERRFGGLQTQFKHTPTWPRHFQQRPRAFGARTAPLAETLES